MNEADGAVEWSAPARGFRENLIDRSRPGPLMIQSADGAVLAAEHGRDSFLGWDSTTFQELDADALLHPDDRTSLRAVRQAVIDDGVVRYAQVRLRSKHGRWVWAEAEIHRYEFLDSELGWCTISYLTDVSAEHLDHEVMALSTEVRALISSAFTVEDAWRDALASLVTIGGADAGLVWEARGDGFRVRDAWMPHGDRRRTEIALAMSRRYIDDFGASSGEWSAASARWQRTGRVTTDVIEAQDGRTPAGTSWSLVIPVMHQLARVTAMIELVTPERFCENEALIVGVAGSLGDAFEQKAVSNRLEAAEAQFRTAIANAPVGVATMRPDRSIEFANDALCRILGRSAEELAGRTFAELTHRDDAHLDTEGATDDGDEHASSRHVEKRYLRPGGDTVWARVATSSVYDDDGVLVRLVKHVEDITARRQAEIQAGRAEARLRATFDDAGVAMALVHVDADPPGRLVEANPAFEALTGIDAAEVGDHGILDVLHPGERADFAEKLLNLVQPSAERFSVQAKVESPDDERWARIVAAPVDEGELAGAFAVVHLEDITEQHLAQEKLAEVALHDPLTGLANRSLIFDRIANAQLRAERSGKHLGVLFMDLDTFKDVNDSLGHHAGDQLLIEIAERLKDSIRPSDTAARLGGDEFVILCDELDEDPAEAQRELESVAKRVHGVFERPIALGAIDAFCTGSIGMELVQGTSMSAQTAIGHADAAMYRAKARGRSRTEPYAVAAQQEAMDRLRMATELRLAIPRDQVRVAYQPIVEVRSQRIAAAEALLRWNHPELGEVPPASFIGVAEDSDLIATLGEFVLDEVCAYVARLEAARVIDDAFYVTVNLSARQLSRSSFVDTYRDRLEAHGLAPTRIAVELTENVLMDAGGSSLGQLAELRDLGTSVGVDDFGTGYASLTYLKDLPINFVKVDQSFIAGLESDRHDRTITEAVIGLGRGLDLRVIAEGVETVAQAEILDELECGFAQGFHYGRPAFAAH
ncbi:MAG: EAL domain-containing protein [Ilumatobacter sp.]